MSGPVATPPAERRLSPTGDYLDIPVRDIMTPGVLTISEDASLLHTFGVMVSHRVHAVLVVGRKGATPLGWVTARGLLGWIGRDTALARARDAVTERPQPIEPSATAREALTALSKANVSHLLVAHAPDLFPEGVVSEMDLMTLVSR
jgi:CBS domain-containing protein